MADPLNQLMPIEMAMRPADVIGLRRDYPSLIEALRLQQTVINQLIIRTGGSGGGENVVNLDDITSDIEELDELADTADFGVFHAADAMRAANEALIIASESGLSGQISEIRSRIDAIEYQAGDAQLIAQISDLRARIEALENGSNT